MKNMLEKIRITLARFFYGRYGVDTLGYAIVIVSLIFSFLSTFFSVQLYSVSLILQVVSYALLIWEVFRMLSKNRQARYRENVKFTGVLGGVKKFFKLNFSKLRDIRTHKYFSCPKCKNNLRVPKGKGEIVITCPVCKTRFDAKT